MIRIPKNKINIKYTSGGEYLVKSTYEIYKGYYYEINGKTYAGKEFNVNSPLLIKSDSKEVNKLITNPSTSLYGVISQSIIPLDNINSVSNKDKIGIRYFVKKINSNPFLIKEVNENLYKETLSNPLYQTIQVNFRYNMSNEELNYLDKQMSGLKEYLKDELIPRTSTDENNPYLKNF